MAATTEVAKATGEFFQLIGKEGAFALGTLFGTLIGCVVSGGMQWLASRERVLRLKVDLDREKELHAQLKLKDDRINALHKELGKHITTELKKGED